MNALHLFFNDLWLAFVLLWGFQTLATWVSRVSLGKNAMSIGPRSFPELSAFSVEEQRRLLHEADKEAFRGWRLIFPALLFAANFSGALALGRMIWRIDTLPYSFLAGSVFMLLFTRFGSWVTNWVEARCIQPFLTRQIEKRHSDAWESQTMS